MAGGRFRIGGAGGRSRGRMPESATINVTSLLDLTMVLLISFMIIAPTLHNGIEVDLPEVEEAEAIDVKESSLLLSVGVVKGTSAVRVVLNDEDVDPDGLRERLVSERVKNSKVTLVVQGDKAVPWEEMAKVIAAVQASGIEGMSLATTPVTEPESD